MTDSVFLALGLGLRSRSPITRIFFFAKSLNVRWPHFVYPCTSYQIANRIQIPALEMKIGPIPTFKLLIRITTIAYYKDYIFAGA